MNKDKYYWPPVEAELMAGVPDRDVARKYNIPLVSIQKRRLNKLGILSRKGRTTLMNKQNRPAPLPLETKNPYFLQPLPEIKNTNRRRLQKRMDLTDAEFKVWMAKQNPLSAAAQWLRYAL